MAYGSAIEAYVALAGRPIPDLAVVDVFMPRIDGLDLVSQLRRTPAYAQMPALLLTDAAPETHSDRQDVAPARYVAKPLTRRVFVAAVTAALTA